MNISEPFVKRPVATSLLSMGLLLFGALAYRYLPMARLPEVEYPTITVFANLPGASPETMATAVATPLESKTDDYLRSVWPGKRLFAERN